MIMRLLIFLLCSCFISCNTIRDFERSEKVNDEWEAKKKQIKEKTELAAKATADRFKDCEKMISLCESKSTKEDLIKCRSDLSSCEYDFQQLQTEYGKNQLSRLNHVLEKCFTYGYEKKDYSKAPKNAVLVWMPSVRGYGKFSTFEECVKAKDADPNSSVHGNVCIRHDWCENKNSLISK